MISAGPLVSRNQTHMPVMQADFEFQKKAKRRKKHDALGLLLKIRNIEIFGSENSTVDVYNSVNTRRNIMCVRAKENKPASFGPR